MKLKRVYWNLIMFAAIGVLGTVGGVVGWSAALLRSYMRLEELFEEYQAELVQSDRSTPVASAPLAAGD